MTGRPDDSAGGSAGRREHGTDGGWWRRLGLPSFKDRQILLRSEQGVRSLKISRRTQVGAALGASALVVWAVVATTGLVASQWHVAEQRTVLQELELGYADLIANMSSRGGALEAVNRRLIRQELVTERLQTRNDEVLAEVESLAAELGVSEAARDDLLASRATLDRQLRETQQRLEALALERRAAEAELAGLLEELQARENNIRALHDERASLERELARRDDALLAASGFTEALEGQIADLGAAVQEAYAAVETLMQERDRLRNTVHAQRSDLAGAETQEEELRTLLQAAWTSLASVSQERDTLRDERGTLLAERDRRMRGEAAALAQAQQLGDLLNLSYLNAAVLGAERDELLDQHGGLVAQVERLENELFTLRHSQEQILAEIRGRADDHIHEVQTGLAFTGLNVDDLLNRLRGEAGRDTGGPMIPALPEALHADPDWAEALDVVSLVGRAAELRDVINRLPVSTPVRGSYRLTSGFGTRRDPFTGQSARHLGMDFAAPRRTSIYASAPGRVIHAGRQAAYGNLVEIDHGLGLITRYAHLHAIDVRVGDEVERGERIGLLGCTGRCTGPHLHYEVLVNGQQRDPANFLRAGRHVFEIAQQAERR